MESLDFSWMGMLPSLIASAITGLLTWLGTFIFYRQKRDSMDISNDAQRSQEWRKLYEESKRDSDDKDKKIDELRRQINELNRRMNDMDRTIQLNSIYRCENVSCKNRRPPIADKPRDESGRYVKRSVSPSNNVIDSQDEEPENVMIHPEDPEPPMPN